MKLASVILKSKSKAEALVKKLHDAKRGGYYETFIDDDLSPSFVVIYSTRGGNPLMYEIEVVIESPDKVATKALKMQANYSRMGMGYGNGYYLAISGDFERLMDIRYDVSFNPQRKADYLKEWIENYWSGKNGAWKAREIEIRVVYG